MSLKNHLRTTITEHIVGSKEHLQKLEESLERLNTERLRQAKYIINLYSLWEDEGLKSTATEYHGTLKEAIEAAEAEFRTINKDNSEKLQARYGVQIKIGDLEFMVPEKFWKKYKSSQR